jgi:hypothetical protein
MGKFSDSTNYGYFEVQFGQSIRSAKSSKKEEGNKLQQNTAIFAIFREIEL